MGEIYRVREDHEIALVRNIEYEFISADELELLISRLSSTLSLMRDREISQEVLQQEAKAQYEDHVMTHSSLVYPFHHEFLEYSPEKRRKASDPVFFGVYFATSPARDGQIKIGFSADIYKRTKALSRKLNGSPVNILAMIFSDDPRTVERVLHRRFLQDALGEEWFRAMPVHAWINKTQRGMTDVRP